MEIYGCRAGRPPLWEFVVRLFIPTVVQKTQSIMCTVEQWSMDDLKAPFRERQAFTAPYHPSIHLPTPIYCYERRGLYRL